MSIHEAPVASVASVGWAVLPTFCPAHGGQECPPSSFRAEGSARPWVGASLRLIGCALWCQTHRTAELTPTPQKRPPEGRVGRCPGWPPGRDMCTPRTALSWLSLQPSVQMPALTPKISQIQCLDPLLNLERPTPPVPRTSGRSRRRSARREPGARTGGND